MLMRNKKNMLCSYLLIHEVPTDFLPEKRDDHRFSRKALKDLTGLENLNITNHLHMEEDSSMKVSLSHTKGLACAAMTQDQDIVSIGVDIEWTDRKYRSGIEKYFLREEDDKALELIELWACKEAAYKALSPIYKGEKTLVIKDFVIMNDRILFEGVEIGIVSVKRFEYLGREVVLSQGIIKSDSAYFDL
jgi:phosphopantetheinyl transferase (holo-ACP synthase)